VLGFFNTYREGKRVTRRTLTEIADQFQYWLKNRSEKWGTPILEPPEGEGDESRRDKFLDSYFQNAKPNRVVAILKAREPARILMAIGDKNMLPVTSSTTTIVASPEVGAGAAGGALGG